MQVEAYLTSRVLKSGRKVSLNCSISSHLPCSLKDALCGISTTFFQSACTAGPGFLALEASVEEAGTSTCMSTRTPGNGEGAPGGEVQAISRTLRSFAPSLSSIDRISSRNPSQE